MHTTDSAVRTISRPVSSRALVFARDAAVVVAGSLFVALCARVTLPLPFTPVPLTLQNFGVLLAAMLLGSRRGFAALALYLAEGASGLPVFNPAGPGGIVQLLGPTGGYLIAYPVVAFVVGWIAERGRKSFAIYADAGLCGELLLFAAGISWLMIIAHVPFTQAARFGLYPFLFAEVIKVLSAAAIASRWRRRYSGAQS